MKENDWANKKFKLKSLFFYYNTKIMKSIQLETKLNYN